MEGFQKWRLSGGVCNSRLPPFAPLAPAETASAFVSLPDKTGAQRQIAVHAPLPLHTFKANNVCGFDKQMSYLRRFPLTFRKGEILSPH